VLVTHIHGSERHGNAICSKKKVMGTNKKGPFISSTVVPLGPGDDPKHELIILRISRDTTTSSDPDWNETEQIVYDQIDQVAGTGTDRG
jgi:hypothetical protein